MPAEIRRDRFPLRGNRVVLAEFNEDNIVPAYIGWLNNPDVVRYSNQRFLSHTVKTCTGYLESMRQSGNLFLTVQLESQFVGTMTAYVSPHHRTADIGILIGERHLHGSGIGTDAWCTLMEFLLNDCGIRKVTAGTLRANVGMLRVMAKAGMVQDGIRVGQELVDDEPTDMLHFAKFA